MARTDQPHKLTFDTFVAVVTDFSNPINEKHRNLDYSKPETRERWNGAKVKIPIWCNTHEEFFEQQPSNHRDLGHGCPKCGVALRTWKKTKKDPIADFRRVHGDVYDYSRVDYVNTHTHVEIICSEHGPFRQKPLNHLQGETCPACWEERRRGFGAAKTEEYVATFAQRSAEVHAGRYAILKAPEHSHDMALLYCPKHGEFEQKAFSHLAGHGCYRCGAYLNRAQKAVAEFVEELGVKVEADNRTILGGPHIDIWVPELNIGVEYHGSYWHTTKRVGNKHRKKWELAEKAGVRLLQIFDFEWVGRRDAVENRLRAILGKTTAIAARKCDMRQVLPGDADVFFDRVHTQGKGSRATIAYGLFNGEELVACASFGKPRSPNSPYQWELYRYASEGRVQGGFQRLFKAFVKQHEPLSVLSYCDLRWGNGDLYKHAGFNLDGITPPDMWYTTGSDRIPRERAIRRPEGLTQAQYVEQQGWEAVHGVGSQRWIWTPVNDLI